MNWRLLPVAVLICVVLAAVVVTIVLLSGG